MYSTEKPHDGEFIVRDFGTYSYDNGVVDASVERRSGLVVKLVAGKFAPMATGDDRNDVVGILRHGTPALGAGATQKVSAMTRMGEVTDEGGRMIYPTDGADAAQVAADKAECIAGLRLLGIILR